MLRTRDGIDRSAVFKKPRRAAVVMRCVCLLLLGLPAIGFAQLNNYVYQDCANQSFGPALSSCVTMLIDKSLKFAQRRDLIEEGLPLNTDPDYMSLSSKLIPVAIPVHDYDAKTAGYSMEENTSR